MDVEVQKDFHHTSMICQEVSSACSEDRSASLQLPRPKKEVGGVVVVLSTLLKNSLHALPTSIQFNENELL